MSKNYIDFEHPTFQGVHTNKVIKFKTKKTPHKFRHLSPGLWGELVSDNFMISIDAIAHGLSPSVL